MSIDETKLQTIEVEVGRHTLSLAITDTVFNPTLVSRLLSKQVEIPSGAVVLDIGTGVGPLAIMAALDGASQVYGVDLMEEACALARHNLVSSGVADRVEIRQGNLFEPVSDLTFDMIINDVSGIAREVARISPWYPETIPSASRDGTEPTVQMVRESWDRLNPGGILYLPTASLADVPRIVAVAHEVYGDHVETLYEKQIPFCTELNDEIQRMHELKEEGIIDFETRRSRNLWTLTVFACRKPV